MSYLTTDRGRFHFEESRSAGPLVYLLHGLTSKIRDWGSIPDLLAKAGFHVFAFDMRGHGESERGGDLTPEGHARDLEACAQVLGHSGIHVVGHSTGGRNALAFAAHFPRLVGTVTVIDQTLRADPHSYEKYRSRYAEYPVPFPDEASLDKFLHKKFKGDERRSRYYKGQFRKDEAGRWDWDFSTEDAWRTQQLGREKDAYDLLPRVGCPALFLKGADSAYVPLEEAERIRDLLPQGRLAVVEGAEHAVFRDNPEGFLKALVPFLRSASFA